MNKLVSKQKGGFHSCWKFISRQVNEGAGRLNISKSAISLHSVYNAQQAYCQSYLQTFNQNSLFNSYPRYQFSMKQSHQENSILHDEQELVANISDNVLRQSQYASNASSESTTFHVVNGSNSSSSSKVQNNFKNQQQDNLQKMKSSPEDSTSRNQSSSNNESHISKGTEQVGNISESANSKKGTSNSTENISSIDQEVSLESETQERTALQQSQKTFKFKDFAELTKLRLSVMNTLVALPTYLYLAETVSPQLIPLGIATQLMAMSSQTTNQILEQKYDKQMTRTQRRPLPSGLISTKSAWMLNASLFAASNAIFYFYFPMNTLLVANAIFFGYIGIYTPMKRETSFNTTVGAIVGALTPYIGYTAAGGSVTDLYPLYYALYMTFWQYQHFYGISWIYKNDYKKAGYQMCDDKNEAMRYMLGSFGINAAANIALFFTNPVYSYLSFAYTSAMAAGYLYYFAKPAYRFYQDPNIENAKKLKNASYIHLSIFFLIIFIDMCLRIYENKCKISLANAESQSQPIKKLDEQSFVGKIHKILFEKKMPKNTQNAVTTPTTSSTSIEQQITPVTITNK